MQESKVKTFSIIVKPSSCIILNLQYVVYKVWKTFVATPLWPSVGVKPNTPKVGDLECSETPECLEFDSKAQNYSH